MRQASLITILLFSLLVAAGPAWAQVQYFGHSDSNGAPDPGTTTPLPNGGSQTNYQDGWTRTDEPDNSFGAGGTKVTEKDGQGRINEITKLDPKGRMRHRTQVAYNANGTKTISYWNYGATGYLIDKKTETVAAAPAPPPPSGPQTGSSGPGGPQTGSSSPGGPQPGSPGSGGPQPDSGPGPGGPSGPGGPGVPVFGGFGFGFGVGGGGEDRGGVPGHKP
jgi:hypothetical protein